MPKVSVVIASYNHEKYVAETIQSILDQTYQDFEIVITDDGSTDGTVTEIKKLTDPRIKLFCFENNRGACVAKRKCLDEAKGEFIAALNSDDVFLPDKLEKQVRFLDEHPELGAVFGYAQIVDENGDDFTDTTHPYYDIFNRSNRTRFEWLNHFFYKGNCLCHPSVLIRNRCYKSIGYYDERYAQLPDFDFWTRLCMRYEIYIIPENLIKFRVRNDEANVSGQRPESMIRTSWEYAHILKNYLKVNSVDILLKVFPEAAEYKNIDSDSIPFVLAMLAWKTGSKIHQEFALDVLAEQLSNREIAKRLAVNFGFRYIDFIGLTGRCDLYGIKNVCNEPEAVHGSHGWKLHRSVKNMGSNEQKISSTSSRIARKIAKAIYFAFTDFSEFRRRLAAFFNNPQPKKPSFFGKIVRHTAYRLTVFAEKYNTRPAQFAGNEDLLEAFVARCRKMHKPRVLELGTKRSIPKQSTTHKEWIPNAGEYIGSDIEPGVDVQVVADAHKLTDVVGEEKFDIIIACATFEHLKYPHLAAHQLMKALKIGGILYIQTHRSFPLHAYPYDYFRFSREALEGLFGTQMGFRVIASGYAIPLSLYSPHLLDRDAPAFANVHVYGEKISETPDNYIYELDLEKTSPFPFPESALAHKYCIGKGLEIGGSAHNPFGLNTLNVDFTDSMDTEFKKEEINLCGKALKVDIVANGDDIPLPDESQDFIVSSHVIEHFPNPIKALVEWDRLVKAGGILFMIVPHKERTFDKHKASTPLSHIVEDFKNNNTEPHTNPDGHDHCWVTKTFIELIRYMIENLRMEWEIVEVQDIDDKAGNGFTIVLRKIKTQEPVRYVQ